MRNAHSLSLALSAWLLILSCTTPRADVPEYDPSQATCVCGQPEAQLDGCPAPKCMRGEGNPDNADCVCGSIFDDEES